MRIETSVKDQIVTVRLFLEHAMAPAVFCGAGSDQAPFIQQLSVGYRGETVFAAELSPNLSEDPFLRFRFKGSGGGTLMVSWHDSQGLDGSQSHDIP